MMRCRENTFNVVGRPGMECPTIMANVTAVPLLSSVTISPAYFDFQVIMGHLSYIQANITSTNCRAAAPMQIPVQPDLCRGANAQAD